MGQEDLPMAAHMAADKVVLAAAAALVLVVATLALVAATLALVDIPPASVANKKYTNKRKNAITYKRKC